MVAGKLAGAKAPRPPPVVEMVQVPVQGTRWPQVAAVEQHLRFEEAEAVVCHCVVFVLFCWNKLSTAVITIYPHSMQESSSSARGDKSCFAQTMRTCRSQHQHSQCFCQ